MTREEDDPIVEIVLKDWDGRVARIYSPRLARREDAAELKLEMLAEEPPGDQETGKAGSDDDD